MRKLFTLIAAIFVAFAVNAATVQVAPGNNGIKNAVLAATAGDVIELSSGIYYEEGNFDFNKSLTIMAAEGVVNVGGGGCSLRRVNSVNSTSSQGTTLSRRL